MDNKDEKVRSANRYLATVRRIHEIEQTALNKIGAHWTNADGPVCAFCGKGYDQSASLVEGTGSVRICVVCLTKINDILLGG
jgi:hypothetical protein